MYPHQKSIQLRLGEGEGADLILRILRGDDEEGFGQRHRLAVKGDLMFFHGLEQSALGLWRGSIDLICEYELRKNRPALESELARFAVIDRHAEHVGRQQVAGELHALEGQPQRLCNRVREGGLPDSRNIFDQEMSARQQARQTKANLRVLAEYDAVDLRKDGIDLGLWGVHWPLSLIPRAIWAPN